MSEKEEYDRIAVDEDFIIAPRHSNSLSVFLKKNQGKETPIPIISKMLNLSEQTVLAIKQKAFRKLKDLLS